jgi:hypothetical protein
MARNGPSKNAMKHGAYSRELILPGESTKEYAMLLADLEEEWTPSGPTETQLVLRLASLIWRDRRQEAYEQSKLQRRAEHIEASKQANYWTQVWKSLAPRFAKATTFVEVGQIATSNKLTLEHITGFVPRPSADQEAKWGPAIAELLEKVKIQESLYGIDAFTATIDPHDVELEMIRSNRVQEDIDRTIKRLVQIKNYKQLLPSRVINVSSRKRPEIANTNKSEKGLTPRE